MKNYCSASHYLKVCKSNNSFDICYQRYTNRYPLEHYDESDPVVVELRGVTFMNQGTDNDNMISGYEGAIAIGFRKKRFTKEEVQEIWTQSKERCHLCGFKWELSQRSRKGWHIDHLIPHIGGGRNVENLSNLKVACAKCNLKKGKGYTERSLKISLRNLIEEFYIGVEMKKLIPEDELSEFLDAVSTVQRDSKKTKVFLAALRKKGFEVKNMDEVKVLYEESLSFLKKKTNK
jgi:hypothetical protein